MKRHQCHFGGAAIGFDAKLNNKQINKSIAFHKFTRKENYSQQIVFLLHRAFDFHICISNANDDTCEKNSKNDGKKWQWRHNTRSLY